jgi:hypothetical protein
MSLKLPTIIHSDIVLSIEGESDGRDCPVREWTRKICIKLVDDEAKEKKAPKLSRTTALDDEFPGYTINRPIIWHFEAGLITYIRCYCSCNIVRSWLLDAFCTSMKI